MGAIQDVAQRFWYSKGNRDKRLSRRISAELYRYQTIEKAAQDLLSTPDDKEKQKRLKNALKPIDELNLL